MKPTGLVFLLIVAVLAAQARHHYQHEFTRPQRLCGAQLQLVVNELCGDWSTRTHAKRERGQSMTEICCRRSCSKLKIVQLLCPNLLEE